MNFDQHLNEKYGEETVNQKQAMIFLSTDEWVEVYAAQDHGMNLWEAIESIRPELKDKVWVIRSADDAIVVQE